MPILDILGDPLASFTDLEVQNDSEETLLVSCGTDLLGVGMAWLTTQMQAHASKPVVYRREDDAIAVCATLGRAQKIFRETDGNLRLETSDKDFLIPTASLVIGGTPIRPKRGDTIEWEGLLHEVVPTLGGEPPWRYSDPHRTMIRIHTNLLDDE